MSVNSDCRSFRRSWLCLWYRLRPVHENCIWPRPARSLACFLAFSLTRSLACSLACSLAFSLACSLAFFLARSLACSLACSLAFSLACSLTLMAGVAQRILEASADLEAAEVVPKHQLPQQQLRWATRERERKRGREKEGKREREKGGEDKRRAAQGGGGTGVGLRPSNGPF